MGLIRGRVRSAGGATLSRTVRAYRRDTGALIGERVSGVGVEVGGDPLFSTVRALYDFDSFDVPGYAINLGADGGFLNTRRTLDTTVKKFGAASLTMTNASLGVGTSLDFTHYTETTSSVTFEGFFRLIADNPSWEFGVGTDFGGENLKITYDKGQNKMRVGARFAPFVVYSSGTVDIPDLTWFHFAISVDPVWVKVFVDGTLVCGAMRSEIDGSGGSPTTTWLVDSDPLANIDSIRISAVARYTENFTPPTEAFPTFGPDNALYGAFTIDTGAYNGPCTVVAYGNIGENAAVYDHIIPI